MKLAIAISALLLAFGGFTFWALERDGVAVVETLRPDGGLRQTHVWFVERAGDLWLEAGSPENGWYRDVLEHPRLALSIDGERSQWSARPVDDDERRRWLRSALRERYGIRDWWVGLFIDSARTIPVRLEAVPVSP